MSTPLNNSDDEKRVLSEFIDLYKNLSCLWDVKSKHFKDFHQKKLAWRLLAAKLKDLDPEANEVSAKKKVDHIRYSYRREAKKVQEAQNHASSSSCKHPYKPKLWYFERLSFIDNINYVKETDTQDDSYIEEDNEMLRALLKTPPNQKSEKKEESQIKAKKSKISENNNNRPTQETPETSRERDLVEISEATKKSAPLERVNKMIPSEGANKTNTFATYVGEKLEIIAPGQRAIAEKLISEALFLAQTNNLRFDSKIETPSLSNASRVKRESIFVESPINVLGLSPLSSGDSSD